MDIAATVNPATVHFRSLSEPSRVSVLEQNYEYDLLEPDKLLRKYVGRDVTLVRRGRTAASTREEEVKARLLSFNTAPVWQIGERDRDRHARRSHPFPGAARQPVSRGRRSSGRSRTAARTRHRVEASYLAGKLSWNADYVLTVGARRQGGRRRRLGHAHQRQRDRVQERHAAARRGRSESRPPGDRARWPMEASSRTWQPRRRPMSQEAFSDYHLYTLGRKTTHQQQRDQAGRACSARPAFPIRKRYVVDGQAFYYRNAQHPGAPLKDVVQVYYQFKNDRKRRPRHADAGRHRSRLPGRLEGRRAVRRRGPHRPHAEGRNAQPEDRQRVRRRRASGSRPTSRRSPRNVYEMEYEVTLRNHKTVPVTVEVNEPIGGTWRMLRSSHEWTKTDAWAAQFHVPVAADGEATVNYRLRVMY